MNVEKIKALLGDWRLKMNVEDHRVLDVVCRTVSTGKRIEEKASQICRRDCCSTSDNKTCFFIEMGLFETGVSGSVMKTCVYLMLLHDLPDFRTLANETFEYLFPGEHISQLWQKSAKQFEDRLKTLPQMPLLQVMLNELGYYLTWMRTLTQNLKKLGKLVRKSLPRYYSKESRAMFSYIHATNLKAEAKQGVEDALFVSTFHGGDGFFGLFYQYMYLVIKSINPGTIHHLKLQLWQFDIDMRRVFVSMGKSVNTMDERLCNSIMPMVWPRNSLSGSQSRLPAIQVRKEKCKCGRQTTRSFYLIIASLDPFQHCFDETERWYCDRMCYIEDFALMVPAITEALQSYKQKDAAKYNKKCKEVKYATIRIDLYLLIKAAFQSKDKWPAPSEVLSEGFDWSTWPVPETTGTKSSEFKFCWSDACKNNYGVGRKLKTCTGCLKAKYCDRSCVEEHWPSHRIFCNNTKEMRDYKQRMEEPQTSFSTSCGEVD